MTPDQLQQFEQMQKDIKAIKEANDVSFVESIKRRLDIPAIVQQFIGQAKIGDLSNVQDTGISNNQVLKYESATGLYKPANDNI